MRGAIHDLVLISNESVDPDEEGRLGREAVARRHVRGHITLIGAGSQGGINAGSTGMRAAQFAVSDATAVARIPLDVPVDGSELVETHGIAPDLDGTWEVASVRTTRLHRRLMLRKRVLAEPEAVEEA